MNGMKTKPKTSRIARRGIHVIDDDDDTAAPVLVLVLVLVRVVEFFFFFLRRMPHPKQQKHPHVSTAITTVMIVYPK